jgi:prepilin-type N-terminal cleavage/methylation domain-containing protein
MTFPRFQRRSPGSQAFTLVELLVAMAVFLVLTVFLAQAVSLVSQAILENSKKFDAAEQARIFFDRLSMDLAARPRRADLGMQFTKNGPAGNIPGSNDSIQFYSGVDGYTSPARQVTWISYQIPTTSVTASLPAYQLERGANSTTWPSTSATVPPVYWLGGSPASFLLQIPAPTSSNYVVLANGIFRMEFCYQINTGVFTNSNITAPIYSNVTALVVAVAVLDSRSLGLLNANQVATLSRDFQDATEGNDPLKDWNTQMAATGFASGLPAQAVQNIRLYERTFYVP